MSEVIDRIDPNLDLVLERVVDVPPELFRPQPNSEQAMPFTAVISMEPHEKGTKYTATAIHRDESERNQHAQMGFHEGWGTTLDQLVELVKTL